MTFSQTPLSILQILFITDFNTLATNIVEINMELVN